MKAIPARPLPRERNTMLPDWTQSLAHLGIAAAVAAWVALLHRLDPGKAAAENAGKFPNGKAPRLDGGRCAGMGVRRRAVAFARKAF